MVLLLIYLVSALDALCFSMVINVMTPYILKLGGTNLQLSLLGSGTALVSLIANPVIGSLSDNLGRKKVLLASIFTCIFANLLSVWETLFMFCLSRVVASLGTQIMSLLKALADDNIQGDKMAAISKMQAFGGIAFIVGALVSGQMAELDNGFQLVFLMISGILTINFVLVTFIKEKKAVKKSFDITVLSTVFSNLSKINWSKYWDLLVLKLIADLALTIFQINWGIILITEYQFTPKHLSYSFAVVITLSTIINLLIPRVKARFYSHDNTGMARLFHGTLILIVGCLGLGTAPSLMFYFLFLPFTSIGRVIFDTTTTEVLLDRATHDEKSSVMGAFDNTMALGGLIGPLISGLISSVWGESTAMLMATIPLSFGAILAFYFTNNLKQA